MISDVQKGSRTPLCHVNRLYSSNHPVPMTWWRTENELAAVRCPGSQCRWVPLSVQNHRVTILITEHRKYRTIQYGISLHVPRINMLVLIFLSDLISEVIDDDHIFTMQYLSEVSNKLFQKSNHTTTARASTPTHQHISALISNKLVQAARTY
jgi:hypothetical protein